MSLFAPITAISGLGALYAKRLAKFGIEKQIHLLLQLPIRYQNKTHIVAIKDLNVGDTALVEGVIAQVEKQHRPRKQLLCTIADNSATLTLRFFHWYEGQAEQLRRGQTIQCYGEVGLKQTTLEMIHPQYRLLDLKQKPLLSAHLSPVYSNTLGLPAAKLGYFIDRILNTLVEQAMELDDVLKNCYPGLLEIKQALLILHRPHLKDLSALKARQHPAQKRLILDELCAHHLALLQVKTQQQSYLSKTFAADKTLVKQLTKQLRFTLTKAQQRAIAQIYADLAKPRAMLRLLQGDVGCGKTIIAVFASLAVISSGGQVAIMAPTEILAKQHFDNFNHYLNPLGFTCGLLVASQSKKTRKQLLSLCQSAEITVVIGTHALLQETVILANLGLVIVDEQHKFGVHQRLSLREKSKWPPHQLVMSATPIPRSLTMSLYADLDTSIIDMLPPDRKPIKTIAVSQIRKEQVFVKIEQICQNKQQVYWVCTLIDDSENLSLQSVNSSFKLLKQQLPKRNIALVHGRLNKGEKNRIMQDFNAKKIDILVATTVVEVGIDTSNATLIVIEDAQRLGLAQLHQLRGRVGRGVHASLCILLYQNPLNQAAKARLDILRKSNDGFMIAQKDLELRGPGELLGAAQTGMTAFKVADLLEDSDLLSISRDIAPCLLKQKKQQQNVLIERWYEKSRIDYGSI